MFEFKKEFDYIQKDGMSLKITEKNNGDDVMLPFYYWDIYVNNINVGKISLRIGSNFHSYYNGNIGYEVFSEYRGNHYAYKACKIILEAASAHKMKELIITCDESNAASYKTIERLGAELIEIAKVPKKYFAWRKGMERKRIYKVKL
ncbi:MAG: GNAT family N-acetyltransferase [Ruminococcaceae bacterium]|nr:GNAT family N-acetyltransferase [Oscillospiraceae bacterium]